MSELVQARLPDGQTVWARVEAPAGPSDVVLRDRVLGVSGFTETLAGVAANVRRAVRGARPDEVTVEFGVELALGGDGLFAALAGVSGNTAIKVVLTWTADTAADTPAGTPADAPAGTGDAAG